MFQSNRPPPFGYLDCLNNSEDDHDEFTERLRKTLYYGKLPGTERPSMPLTEMAVEFFQEAAPRKLGKLDTYFAASSSRSACMTPTSVIVGMMYVRRLQKRKPEYLAQISSSELFLISMMMASKFMYDEGVDEEVFNDEWANSGDLDTEDVNELERDFLNAMDWELFVKPDDFADMLDTVEKRVALREGLDRGWFSYTDLHILSRDLRFMNWNDLAAELSKVMSVSSLAYLASVLTMIGSTVLGTAASSTLLSAGAAMLPTLSHNAPGLTLPSMPWGISDLGSGGVLMMQELAKLEVGNASQTELQAELKLPARALVGNTESCVGHCDAVSDSGSGISETPGAHVSRDNKPPQPHNDNSEGSVKPSVEGFVKPSVESVTREQGTFLNSFIPPFLALVALKDTLVKFAYAVTEKPKIDAEDEPDADDADQPTEICSDGPCLMDSWPNCWNVSSEFDWTEFKAVTSRCASNPTQRCMVGSRFATLSRQSGLDHGHVEQCKLGNNRGGGRLGRTCTHASGVHCCCRWTDNDDGSDFASLNQQLPDLNYGFMTSSILITV